MNDPVLDLYGECTPQHLLDNPMIREKILRQLESVSYQFHQQFSNNPNLSLNLLLLRETVESCICDVYRLKFFRGIHHEDNHKRAAFLMNWITKIRPIQIITMTKPLLKMDCYANELLALFVGLDILDISPKWLKDTLPEYFSNIVYLLHFHSCEPEQLASELFLLDKLYTVRETSV
jgi:hypothetical protein